jgi:hypothetical protein
MKRRRDAVIVILILTVGWTFWLQRMGVNDHDDAAANEILFAREPVTTIVLHNPWPDQSPLYFLVLHATRRLGESPHAIQFLNGLLLTMTLAATYVLGRAFSGSVIVAQGAIFLGAISPASLWLVRNGRMYSIQVLLSVLSLLCVLAYLDRRERRDLAAFAVFSVLHIYTHFIGFLITAVLALSLVADTWFEAQRRRRRGAPEPWESLRPIALAGLAILLAVVPQLLRFISLVRHGIPLRFGLSAPVLSRAFLDRVTWFWFINADWGRLARGGRVVTAVYLGSIGALAAAGLVAARRRHGGIAALCIAIPVVGLGLAAGYVDVRTRYFVWLLPLLWVAVASGAVGTLHGRSVADARTGFAQGIRSALAVVVVAGSVWLLWHKVPERYAQWTKLMIGVQQIYQPSIVVYMPPGPPAGTPRLLASYRGLASGLADIRPLSSATRAQFLTEVERTRDFVFLAQWSFENEELAWRSRYLVDRKYQRTVFPVWGARAEIFTHGEIDELSRAQRLEGDSSPSSIVSWARRRLHEKRRAAAAAPLIGEAVVARIDAQGALREGRLFTSQYGENGSWRLGPAEWDVIEQTRAFSGAVERAVITADPTADTVLVAAFPAVKMKTSVSVTYGIVESGSRLVSGADVNIQLYVDGVKKADAVCPNRPGWNELIVDTASLQGTPADIVVLMTSRERSHFAFDVATSSRITSMPIHDPTADASGPAVLVGGSTLKDWIDRLSVYRTSDTARIEAQHVLDVRSAGDMHEAAGPNGEGAVRTRWVLGPAVWDTVGVTRQRSGGEARDGLWAHPRDGTILVIEASVAPMGHLLRGYFGITDFAIAKAAELGVTAPVRMKILLDGRLSFENDVPRVRGWRTFAVPISDPQTIRSVRIEIECATDSWAHFIFDLWSE